MSFGLDQYFKKEKTKKTQEEKPKTEKVVKISESGDLEERDWPLILEETVKSMILYPHLLDYTRTNILPQNPSINPEELAIQLHTPLGVAIVLLERLKREAEETE
ncbi:MAG: hypothetical protein ACFE8F_00555 [Promethearchaeota archaeon]